MHIRTGSFASDSTLLGHLAREHGCEIIVLNQERLLPEEDLLSIAHTFSRLLHRMCNYKKQIRENFPGSSEPKETLE